MTMLRYMDTKQMTQAIVTELEKVVKAMDYLYKEGVKQGYPALADSSLRARDGAADTVDVLREMAELSYPEDKKIGNVYNIFTKGVIA